MEQILKKVEVFTIEQIEIHRNNIMAVALLNLKRNLCNKSSHPSIKFSPGKKHLPSRFCLDSKVNLKNLTLHPFNRNGNLN